MSRLHVLLALALLLGCDGDKPSTVDQDGDGAARDVDCDDHDATRFPSNPERCDGFDEDCDGIADNDAVDALVTYTDLDGDHFGDPASAFSSCVAPVRGVSDGTDCDDTDASVFPGAYETCDGRDEDCDGAVDLGAIDARTRYPDADADGHGDEAGGVTSCEAVGLAEGGDCDDGDPTVFPGAEERCDAVDTNCDGLPDVDAIDGEAWYVDADGDGYGDPDADAVIDCAADGRAPNRYDCDDADAALNPASGGCGLSGEGSAGDAAVTLDGLDEGDAIGAVHDAADLDGDGIAELLVGTPSEGAFYVLAGPIRGDESLASPLAKRRYVAGTTSFATSLAVGDFDGDGNPDVAAGAPDDDTVGINGGRIWLFAGPLSGSTTEAAALRTIDAEAERSSVGDAMVAVPDADGDGLADLLLGAPDYLLGAGRVYLVGGTHTDLASPIAVFDAATLFDRAGTSLAAGDLDGDGLSDLVIGAPSGPEAYVMAGGVTGTVSLEDADSTLGGRGSGYQTGKDVAIVGDQDGDGLPDLLVGGPTTSSSLSTTGGESWIIVTPLAGDVTLGRDEWATLMGEATGDAAGGSVAGGDLDGDGHDDLAIGAVGNDRAGGNAGAVYVFYGITGGTTELAAADALLFGHAASLALGSSLLLEDLDGDTRADLVAGGVGETVGGTGAGATWIWLGGGR
ncbi:MAG: MopE-related protein [Pseudomonadota bacterium]|nr:MopE-related protein [Pseudomonadota bacterium]